MALTESSEIYTWGANKFGQLGLGYCSPNAVATPTLIQCLSGLPVRQLASGANHSLLVTPSGSVYAWGANSNGQLGLGGDQLGAAKEASKERDEPTPHLLKGMKRQRVVFAACGESHSALLTLEGGVFTFGSGR